MVKPVASKDLNDLAAFSISGKAGEFVFREGETSTEVYLIQEGRIEILKDYSGDLRRLALLDVGDFFGEVSLLEGQPREVSARGATEYRLLRIDASAFEQIVQEEPVIAMRMLRRLAVRLKDRQDADVRAAKAAKAAPVAAPVAPPPPPPLRQDDIPTPVIDPARAAAALAAPTRMVLAEPLSGIEFDVTDRKEATVGRIDRATGFRPDVDLTDLDTKRTLSRRHARLIRRGGDLCVREEHGAHNGTFVNGERIATGVDVKLTEGARVRFGLVELVFHQR